MSVAIGASATGARTYTATASQGLLYMIEAVYNASGLGLPIVMTVANRAIGGPINIWNDHSDSMSQRDCGWLQLYAENNQEAVDLHIQAFRIAEEMSIPVMVCMDGFILTHAYEQVDIPTREEVKTFLPPFTPRQHLDPADPVSIGAMVGPESFTEVKYLAHQRMIDSLRKVQEVADDFERHFGRKTGGQLRSYRTEGADTVVLALGSVIGTLKDVVDELQLDGHSIGLVGLTSFRPFPFHALAEALKGAKRVVILEKAFSTGTGGIVTQDVVRAIEGMGIKDFTVIAGLGGRPITIASLREYLTNAMQENVERITFLDLETETIEKELSKERALR